MNRVSIHPDGSSYTYDDHGRLIHHAHVDGFSAWYDYGANGIVEHYRDSDGDEFWLSPDGTPITKEQYDRLHAA